MHSHYALTGGLPACSLRLFVSTRISQAVVCVHAQLHEYRRQLNCSVMSHDKAMTCQCDCYLHH